MKIVFNNLKGDSTSFELNGDTLEITDIPGTDGEGKVTHLIRFKTNDVETSNLKIFLEIKDFNNKKL